MYYYFTGSVWSNRMWILTFDTRPPLESHPPPVYGNRNKWIISNPYPLTIFETSHRMLPHQRFPMIVLITYYTAWTTPSGQASKIVLSICNIAYSILSLFLPTVVSQPKGDWKAEDFASVGELILDISISLART